MQKTNQKEFRTEKVLKRKGDKLLVKWKGYENSFNSWTSQYFPKPSSHEENIKVEIDLSNYAKKKDINDITHVDTSNLKLKN